LAYDFAEQKLEDGPDVHGLDKDDIASIYLYTTNVLYQVLNEVLRAEDRDQAKEFFLYMRLLLSALDKIPNEAEGTVYRGVKLNLADKYKKGKTFYEWTFMSTTEDGTALSNPQFLGSTGDRSLLSIHLTCGKNISSYSAYRKEKEVLVPPGFKWKIENSMPMPGQSDFWQYSIFQASEESFVA